MAQPRFDQVDWRLAARMVALALIFVGMLAALGDGLLAAVLLFAAGLTIAYASTFNRDDLNARHLPANRINSLKNQRPPSNATTPMGGRTPDDPDDNRLIR